MGSVTVGTRNLLGQLRELGARVSPDGDSFSVRPASVVTAELAAALRGHREEIVGYLGERPTWPCSKCGKHGFPTPRVSCYWCGKKNRAGVETRPYSEGNQPSIHSPQEYGRTA